MNAQTFHNFNTPALQRSLVDVVAEYDKKAGEISQALRDFVAAGNTLKMATTIAGVYGDVTLNTGHVYESEMKMCLLKSVWKHVFEGLQLDRIATAKDKQRWKTELEKPAPFTLANIRATFGHYILDPRGNILRGLAEVFCSLDPVYKSHDKVKIGVKGLPKRIIVGYVGYSDSHGMKQLRDMFNALAAYRGEPLMEYKEFAPLDALHSGIRKVSGECVIRGLRLKKYGNGNVHVMFDSRTLRDVNKALAEFYGQVLPDTTDEPPAKKQASTAVAKDLQFYPTPRKVIDDILQHRFSVLACKRILEPECGTGAIMEARRRRQGEGRVRHSQTHRTAAEAGRRGTANEVTSGEEGRKKEEGTPMTKTYTPEEIRDVSEKVYRAKLEQSCAGDTARMIEKDGDQGQKLRNRAGSYDTTTRTYLEVLGLHTPAQKKQPTSPDAVG